MCLRGKVIISVGSWLRHGHSSDEGNLIVGNLFPREIRELIIKLLDKGAISAKIDSLLGDFYKGGTVPARKIVD